jgi:hypothetical protein
MHFTEKSCLKLSNYTVNHLNHPVGTARGTTATIKKNSIKHQYSNQSGLVEYNSSFYFQHRNPKSFAHVSGRTLIRAEYGYPKGSPNTNS